MTLGTSLRIAHVTTVHRPFDNRIFHKECRALSEAGNDVHLVAVDAPTGAHDGVQMHSLPTPKGRLSRIGLSARVMAALLRLRPDVAHIHDPELLPVGLAWRLLTRGALVYDAHEDLVAQLEDKPYIPTYLRALVRLLARGLVSCADRWATGIVIAEPALRRLFPRSEVALVQNFPWRRDFVEPSPYPSENRTLVYIGGISEGRGIAEMCRVAESSGADTLLLAGPTSDSKAKRLVEDCVKMDYRGVVAPRDIPDLLAWSNVGLCLLHPLPNYVDAQSTKVFEYMAAARPFIYSNFPSWVAMFEPLGVGAAVDPTDVGATVEVVEEWLADPLKAAEVGERGRRAFEDRFSFEAEVGSLLDLVERAAAAGARNRFSSRTTGEG